MFFRIRHGLLGQKKETTHSVKVFSAATAKPRPSIKYGNSEVSLNENSYLINLIHQIMSTFPPSNARVACHGRALVVVRFSKACVFEPKRFCVKLFGTCQTGLDELKVDRALLGIWNRNCYQSFSRAIESVNVKCSLRRTMTNDKLK
jgi:hypothetical protein